VQLAVGDSEQASRLRHGLILGGWVFLLSLSALFSGEWNAWFMAVFFVLVFLLVFFAMRLPLMNGVVAQLTPMLTVLGVLLAVLLASAMHSGYLADGLAQWAILAAYGCMLVVGAALRAVNPSGNWLSRPVVLAAAGVALWSLIHDLPQGGPLRLTSTLGNANALGGFLLLAAPMAISQFMVATGRWRALWAACLAVIGTAFFLTFSYTAWAALMAAAIAALVMVPNARRAHVVGVVGAALAIGAIVAAFALLPRSPVTQEHLLTSFHQRAGFNTVSLRMVGDAWALGFGPGSYQSVFARYATNFNEQPKYAHNEFFQMFAEGGVAAGVLFLAFGWLALRAIRRVVRQRPSDVTIVGVAIAVLASFVNAAVDFGWHFPAVGLTLWVGVGFLLVQPGAAAQPSRGAMRVTSITLLVLSMLLLVRGLTLFLATASSDRAQLLQRRGDIAGAQSAWRQAVKFDPQPTSFRTIGWNAYSDRTNPQWASEAQAAADQAKRWGRDDYFVAHLLGRIAYAQKNYPVAEAQLRRAISLDPLFHVSFQHDLAFVMRDQGRLNEAIALLQFTLEQADRVTFSQNPTRSSDLAYVAEALGQFQLQQGDVAAARAAFERALAYVPDYRPALDDLAALK